MVKWQKSFFSPPSISLCVSTIHNTTHVHDFLKLFPNYLLKKCKNVTFVSGSASMQP